MKTKIRNNERELEELHRELNKMRGTNSSMGESLDSESVRKQLQTLELKYEEEKSRSGKVLDEQQKEISECRKDLDTFRDDERKLKSRIKELESELEASLKKIDLLNRGSGAS